MSEQPLTLPANFVFSDDLNLDFGDVEFISPTEWLRRQLGADRMEELPDGTVRAVWECSYREVKNEHL